MSFNIFNSEQINNLIIPNVFNTRQYMFDESFDMLELIGNCLNKVNENVNLINTMEEALAEFEKFVSDEINNFHEDIENEIHSYVDLLIANGTIAKLINEVIFGKINSDISNLTSTVNQNKTATDNKFTIIDQEIKDLNYAEPSSILSIHPTQLIYNKGEIINSVVLNFTVLKGSNDLVKAEIYKNNSLIGTMTNVIDGDNSFTDANIITTDSAYYVKIYDNKSSIQSNVINLSFITNYYYGTIKDDSNINSILIKTLSSLKVLKQNLNENFTCQNEKIVFAYPQLYGELINIKYDDINWLESFDRYMITIDNIGYFVYVSKLFLTDSFDLNFNVMNDDVIKNILEVTQNVDGGKF